MVAGLTRLLIRRRILVPLMLVVTATTAWAAWSVPGTGSGAAIASPDFHAPSVSLSTIAPAGVTGAGGGARAGGQFVVYANLTDPGGSGVASALADVSALAAGMSSVPLTPCVASCTIGTKTYGWTSAPVTRRRRPRRGRQQLRRLGHRRDRQHRLADRLLGDRRQLRADRDGEHDRHLGDHRRRLGRPGRHLRRLCLGHRRRIAGHRHELRDRVRRLDHHRPDRRCRCPSARRAAPSAASPTASRARPPSPARRSPPAPTAYSVTATDLGGNAASGNYSVTVDNTAPAVSAAVVSTSATSTPGLDQAGRHVHHLRERHRRRRDQHRQGERRRR